MTGSLVARCGKDCGRCPWSVRVRETVKTDEELEELKKKTKIWLGTKYFLNFTPDTDPCKMPCLQGNLEDILQSCAPHRVPIRCNIYNEIENCAYCSRFPCAMVNAEREWLDRELDKEFFKKELGKDYSDEDYVRYIEHCNAYQNLAKLHKSLDHAQLKDPKPPPPPENEIVELPADHNKPDEQKLHRVLSRLFQSDLGVEDLDVFAGNYRWMSRRKYLRAILWSFGVAGIIKDGVLHVTADKYQREKHEDASADVDSLTYYCRLLEPLGIIVQFKLLTEKDAHMDDQPQLKDTGWTVSMSFTKDAGGTPVLNAFHCYIRKLEQKHDKNAFTHFFKLDMNNL